MAGGRVGVGLAAAAGGTRGVVVVGRHRRTHRGRRMARGALTLMRVPARGERAVTRRRRRGRGEAPVAAAVLRRIKRILDGVTVSPAQHAPSRLNAPYGWGGHAVRGPSRRGLRRGRIGPAAVAAVPVVLRGIARRRRSAPVMHRQRRRALGAHLLRRLVLDPPRRLVAVEIRAFVSRRMLVPAPRGGRGRRRREGAGRLLVPSSWRGGAPRVIGRGRAVVPPGRLAVIVGRMGVVCPLGMRRGRGGAPAMTMMMMMIVAPPRAVWIPPA
mmetsp:Transcript_42697/g.129699  ORF Transcript_42697/g.129699 Transcript_42697/m.129699 type:complete len:270 (+) Transcript_42697:1462-2271(+)